MANFSLYAVPFPYDSAYATNRTSPVPVVTAFRPEKEAGNEAALYLYFVSDKHEYRMNGPAYPFLKSETSETHNSTPPGMFALVLLIYKTLESASHTISETSLSFVSRLISPVFRSIRLHQEEDS